MKELFFYHLITFFTLAGVALFINFCRRRLSKTKHGLTGMCHKDGGAMCCSCSEKMVQHSNKQSPRPL